MRGRANQLNQPTQVVKGGFAETRQSWSLGLLKSDPLFFHRNMFLAEANACFT